MSDTSTEIKPLKPLIYYSSLQPNLVASILKVINIDEGGWKLTEDTHDNDGGFTFGGMTAKVLQEYYPGYTKDSIVEIINNISKTDEEMQLKKIIISIYAQEYAFPLISIFGTQKDNPTPQAMHLSCAINCGIQGCKEIILTSFGSHLPNAFITAWLQHYVRIVKDNPSKLEYLAGWVNRVMRYV